MTTLEPLTEAELNQLQANWMAGNRREQCDPHEPCPRQPECDSDKVCIYRCQFFPLGARGIGTPSWFVRESARIPDFDHIGPSPLGSDPLAEDWTRHTVDITRQPVSVEDEPIAYVRPWKWLAALAVVGLFYAACWFFIKWVAHR